MNRLLHRLPSADPRVRRARTIVASILTTLIVVGIGVLAWPATLGGKATWVTVSGTSMEPNYATGDLVLAWNDGKWELGDVVLYGLQSQTEGLIVHRLVSGSAEAGWYAQGDNKPRIDPWLIPDDAIGGREILHIPNAGTALAWVRTPQVLAILCGLLVFWAVLTGPQHIRRRIERVPMDEPAVVAGRASRTVDLHIEGGRFNVPRDLDIQVGEDVAVEVWLTGDSGVHVARGTLSVRHIVSTEDACLVGGPVVWADEADRAAVSVRSTSKT